MLVWIRAVLIGQNSNVATLTNQNCFDLSRSPKAKNSMDFKAALSFVDRETISPTEISAVGTGKGVGLL